VNRLDADFIKLTYKDNEFLSKEEVNEIEGYKAKGYDSEGNEINAYWANKWRVYGLGEEGRIDGTIFQNWELGQFDESIPVMYGIDWGFKDPFVLIKVAFDKKSMRCYVKEEIYKSMLSPNEIAQLVKAKIPNRNSLIIADSADPTQIIGLRNEGFNIMPATKEKIIIGIRALQNWQIVITPESTNVINEFHNYIWLDKSGEVPISGFDHSIDPLRYVEKFYRYKNS
jgi:phage terminase large subunit